MPGHSRQFDLRPGVRMPDWSMVTQPAGRSRSKTDPSAPGHRLTVDEAMEFGKAIFRPIRAGVTQDSSPQRSTRRE